MRAARPPCSWFRLKVFQNTSSQNKQQQGLAALLKAAVLYMHGNRIIGVLIAAQVVLLQVTPYSLALRDVDTVLPWLCVVCCCCR